MKAKYQMELVSYHPDLYQIFYFIIGKEIYKKINIAYYTKDKREKPREVSIDSEQYGGTVYSTFQLTYYIVKVLRSDSE